MREFVKWLSLLRRNRSLAWKIAIGVGVTVFLTALVSGLGKSFAEWVPSLFASAPVAIEASDSITSYAFDASGSRTISEPKELALKYDATTRQFTGMLWVVNHHKYSVVVSAFVYQATDGLYRIVGDGIEPTHQEVLVEGLSKHAFQIVRTGDIAKDQKSSALFLFGVKDHVDVVNGVAKTSGTYGAYNQTELTAQL